MSTSNLNLELIELTDTMREAFRNKLNSNMQILDTKYGELISRLELLTGQTTLENALNKVSHMSDTRDANAISSDIISGKTAYVNEQKVTGTFNGKDSSDADAVASEIVLGKTAYVNNQKIVGTLNMSAPTIPVINITLTGSNATYISGYGAGIDQNGNLVIWAMSGTSSYEHIYFVASNVIGTKGAGWDKTNFDTSDPINIPHACTLTDVVGYNIINITLNASAVSSSSDYVKLDVTVTGV